MRDDAYKGVEGYELYITQGGAWGARGASMQAVGFWPGARFTCSFSAVGGARGPTPSHQISEVHEKVVLIPSASKEQVARARTPESKTTPERASGLILAAIYVKYCSARRTTAGNLI